jgi:hypothetical protein
MIVYVYCYGCIVGDKHLYVIYMSVSSGFILLVADELTVTLITPSYNGHALWCDNVLRSQQLRYFSYLLRYE